MSEKKAKAVKSDSTKRRAQRTTSNVFAMFTQNQIAEFKEAFQFIDSDKDGIIGKNDIRATFDALGRIVTEQELDSMLAEAAGPINFTMFLSIFGERISGADNEDVLKSAFRAFDHEECGLMEEEELRKHLTTYGERMNIDEFEDAFRDAPIDKKGNVKIEGFVKQICGSAQDEEQKV